MTGDEPLQFNESLDAIRAAAREQGFAERTVLDAETGFDWSRLAEAAASLSLFAERRLIELRLPSGRPGTEGGKALAAFAAEAGDDVVLLVGAGRIEARAKRSAWYRAIDGAGAAVEVWPKERSALPAWLRERARSRGLDASPEAIEELADRCEGNLAYGAQTIERLALLVSGGRIEIDDVLDGAAHGARFTSFDLVDATLAGNAPRALAVLAGLGAEGEAPPAIIGALAWQVRTIARNRPRPRAGSDDRRRAPGVPRVAPAAGSGNRRAAAITGRGVERSSRRPRPPRRDVQGGGPRGRMGRPCDASCSTSAASTRSRSAWNPLHRVDRPRPSDPRDSKWLALKCARVTDGYADRNRWLPFAAVSLRLQIHERDAYAQMANV